MFSTPVVWNLSLNIRDFQGIHLHSFIQTWSSGNVQAVKTIPWALKGCSHVQYFVEQICFSALSQTPPGTIPLVMSHHEWSTQINKLKSAEDSNVPRQLHQLVCHPDCLNKPSIISSPHTNSCSPCWLWPQSPWGPSANTQHDMQLNLWFRVLQRRDFQLDSSLASMSNWWNYFQWAAKNWPLTSELVSPSQIFADGVGCRLPWQIKWSLSCHTQAHSLYTNTFSPKIIFLWSVCVFFSSCFAPTVSPLFLS